MNGWDEIKDNAVFFGGHRKNGTTLFIAMLDGHPDLFVYPYETYFWFAFYPIFVNGDYSYKQKKERVKEFIFSGLKNTIRVWMGFKENELKHSYQEMNELFEGRIDASDGTTKDFFDAIMFTARELLPDKNYSTHRKWVEKTTCSELYADKIFDMYPRAKFIQIIRDPRDNWAVIRNGWEKHYKNQYDSIDQLLRSVIDRNYLEFRLATENEKIFGSERYTHLKYEDLILDPESTLRRLCDFIGINFNQLVPVPTFCGIPWQGNSFADIRYSGLSKERVGIHNAVPRNELQLLEYYFGDFMEKFGYATNYDEEERVNSMRCHYKWFNYNQPWSMKPVRKDYDHLKTD